MKAQMIIMLALTATTLLQISSAAQGDSRVLISVRVVDVYWAPIPGIEINVRRVDDCRRQKTVAARTWKEITRPDGSLDVGPVPSGSHVAVSTNNRAGFETQNSCFTVSEGPVAYIPIRLRADLARQQSIHGNSQARFVDGRLSLGSAVGVYSRRDDLLEVDVTEDGKGLTLSLPDGRVLSFIATRGSAFSGQQGDLSFVIADGKVTGLVFKPGDVTATRR
jgi:hypothetical protein